MAGVPYRATYLSAPLSKSSVWHPCKPLHFGCFERRTIIPAGTTPDFSHFLRA